MKTTIRVDRAWLTRLFTEGESVVYTVLAGLPRFAGLINVELTTNDMIVFAFDTNDPDTSPETRIVYEQGEVCPKPTTKVQPIKKRLL